MLNTSFDTVQTSNPMSLNNSDQSKPPSPKLKNRHPIHSGSTLISMEDQFPTSESSTPTPRLHVSHTSVYSRLKRLAMDNLNTHNDTHDPSRSLVSHHCLPNSIHDTFRPFQPPPHRTHRLFISKYNNYLRREYQSNIPYKTSRITNLPLIFSLWRSFVLEYRT